MPKKLNYYLGFFLRNDISALSLYSQIGREHAIIADMNELYEMPCHRRRITE
jgi:hypothetical protein